MHHNVEQIGTQNHVARNRDSKNHIKDCVFNRIYNSFVFSRENNVHIITEQS
jgi:hypothetical protein